MKIFLLCMFCVSSISVLYAQKNGDDNYTNDEGKGFKKENVFVGGAISLGFGSGSFGVGANPEIGYSVAQWLDAGVAFNINYNSQRLYDGYSGAQLGKTSSFNYGGGVFARAYPLPFLFLQLQPEFNWINYKQKDNYGNSIRQTVNAPSLIGGIGYGQRVIGQGSYFFMVGLDLINDKNSPYNDGYGHANPIIRGGFDIYLRPSRKPARRGGVL